MSRFIKKNFLILIFTLLGFLIGIFCFFLQNQTYIFRTEYEYSKYLNEDLTSHLNKDTAFLYLNQIVVRNYKTSIADTLQNKGIYRGELKIQLNYPTSSLEKTTISKGIINSKQITIIKIKGEQVKKSYSSIYYACSIGFFLAVVFRYFSSISKQTPIKEDITTPN